MFSKEKDKNRVNSGREQGRGGVEEGKFVRDIKGR